MSGNGVSAEDRRAPGGTPKSLFRSLHRRLGSGLRWDVFWHSVRRREVRLALGFLIWPSGWSHTRTDSLRPRPWHEGLDADDFAVIEMDRNA